MLKWQNVLVILSNRRNVMKLGTHFWQDGKVRSHVGVKQFYHRIMYYMQLFSQTDLLTLNLWGGCREQVRLFDLTDSVSIFNPNFLVLEKIESIYLYISNLRCSMHVKNFYYVNVGCIRLFQHNLFDHDMFQLIFFILTLIITELIYL